MAKIKLKASENQVTAAIIEGLTAKGYKVWKTFSPPAPIFRDGEMIFRRRKKELQTAGLPDLIALGHNRLLFIEVKATDGKLSQEQFEFQINIEAVTRVNGLVAKSWDDVEKYLK